MGLVKLKRKKKKSANTKLEIGKASARIIFSHVGLFLLVSVYAVLGAYILILIELPDEELRVANKKAAVSLIKADRKYLVDDAWHKSSLNLEETKFKDIMKTNFNLYKNNLIRHARTSNYDGGETWSYDWTLTKSLLFTVTTIGAIGYGHIYPKTAAGQLFTIYYGMIGIPLLLLFLANIGNMMAKSLRFVYSRLCCRWCRARRKLAESKCDAKKIANRAVYQDDVGHEPYMPTDLIDVPIMVNLIVIAVYLALGGIYFSLTENWKVHESIYFAFITLTTIGFGDYVPGKSFYDTTDTLTLVLNLIATLFYCLFGMALLSMAINLMQEQIIQKAHWIAIEAGIMEEDYDPVERYKVKKACEENMLVTPSGKDGNKDSGMLLNADEDFGYQY